MPTPKTVFAPHLNRTVRFGRIQPRVIHPHLKLRNYLRASLPAAPSSADYSKPSLTALTNVYENDTLGDCVIAGGYHVTGVATGNAGDLFVASNAQIIKDYSAIGGYVPGDPSTDNGCELQTALQYWTSHGFANGTKLLGYLSVDPTNKAEVMAACYLFENLYMGGGLPDAWISPFPSANGFSWGAGTPDPNNGHCIMSYGYDTAGVLVDSWGLFGTVTWAGLADFTGSANGGELYVMLTPDMLAKAATKAPNGVAWSALVSDWDSMGGSVPVPTPTPAPPVPTPPAPTPPTPAPTPGAPTLAHAQAAVLSALDRQPSILSRQQAITVVNAALKPLW
jgi:hypothetical protein